MNLIDVDPDDRLEMLGTDYTDKHHVATCVDLSNRVTDKLKAVALLATLRSDIDFPHVAPLFKYKGQYYTRGRKGYSAGYADLDEIGTRWFQKKTDVKPKYLDVWALDNTHLDEPDARKVLEEIKRKAKHYHRVYYN